SVAGRITMISTKGLALLAAWSCLACGAAAADHTCSPIARPQTIQKGLCWPSKLFEDARPLCAERQFHSGVCLETSMKGWSNGPQTATSSLASPKGGEFIDPTRWRFYLRPNVERQDAAIVFDEFSRPDEQSAAWELRSDRAAPAHSRRWNVD